MKRGISLVTSLMMTSSVFGGALSQAFIANPAAIVSAASEKPLIGLGNAENKGTTKIGYGQKNVSIPVIINAAKLAAMKAEVSVTSNVEGEANPVIKNIRGAGIPDFTIGVDKGNRRLFLWNDPNAENKTFDDYKIAYIDIELPYDSVTSKESTYTLKINTAKLQASDHDMTPGYAFDTEGSDLEEVIAFNDNVNSGYKLSFTKLGTDGKWHPAGKKMGVNPGETVKIGLDITSPAISGLKYKYEMDERLTFKSFECAELQTVNSHQVKISQTLFGMLLVKQTRQVSHLKKLHTLQHLM